MVAGQTRTGVHAGDGGHGGSPYTIAASQHEVARWAEAQGHRLALHQHDSGASWTGFAEHYLTDPDEEPDPANWVTELLFQVV